MSILVGLTLLPGAGGAADRPDFVIGDILTIDQGFIYIDIENRSAVTVPITPELMEKPFLVIYLNRIKRAEYRLKYLDPRLFQKNGRIRFRTNFRAQGDLQMKVEINGSRVISETNYQNNVFVKIFKPPTNTDGQK